MTPDAPWPRGWRGGPRSCRPGPCWVRSRSCSSASTLRSWPTDWCTRPSLGGRARQHRWCARGHGRVPKCMTRKAFTSKTVYRGRSRRESGPDGRAVSPTGAQWCRRHRVAVLARPAVRPTVCCVSVGRGDVRSRPGLFNLGAARGRHQPIDHPQVLAGLVGVELPVQSLMLFRERTQDAPDPAGDQLSAFLIGAAPGDVVDDDANPDRELFASDIEILGSRLVEDRDHVEPGQPDLLVVIGDPRCELVFLLLAEDAWRVMNRPQWHDSSVLLGCCGQWAKAKVRRSTGPDSAALTLMVMSSVRTSTAPSSSPSTMRLATSAGVIFGIGMAETMSVSMNPACTPRTWVFCGSSSARREFVTDHIAALEAP